MAHGLGDGLLGATVAAWPTVVLVGSYQPLMMIIRSAAEPPEQSAQPPRDARLAADPAGRPKAGDVSIYSAEDELIGQTGTAARPANVLIIARGAAAMRGWLNPAT